MLWMQLRAQCSERNTQSYTDALLTQQYDTRIASLSEKFDVARRDASLASCSASKGVEHFKSQTDESSFNEKMQYPPAINSATERRAVRLQSNSGFTHSHLASCSSSPAHLAAFHAVNLIKKSHFTSLDGLRAAHRLATIA